jgi:hypothetical protein
MFTEDYILRQVNLLVAVLAKITGLKKAGEFQEAQKVIDQAIESAFGLDAGLIKQLDENSLTSLITTTYGIDLGKLHTLAGLLEAEGDVLTAQHRETEAHQSYQRALGLFYEFSSHPDNILDAELSSRINALQKKLGVQD